MLLLTLIYKFSYGHVFSVLLGTYLRMQLLGHMVTPCSTVKENAKLFSTAFTFPLAVYENFNLSTSLPTLFIFHILNVLLLLERGGREKERERNIRYWCVRIHRLSMSYPQLGTWPLTQACALTRNRTSDLSVCRPVLNPLSQTSQGCL